MNNMQAQRSICQQGWKGFTLVEVMLAIAIIGITVVVLLGRRTDIIEEARLSRDLRQIWVEAIRSASESEVELKKQKDQSLPFEFNLERGIARVEEVEVETSEKWEQDKEPRIKKIWRITVPVLDQSGLPILERSVVYYYFPRPK